MIHLNNVYRNMSSGHRLFSYIIHEHYFVRDIQDFWSNIDKIKPTTKLWPPAVLQYGFAMVDFPSAKIERIDNKSIWLYDSSSSIDTNLLLGTIEKYNKGSLEDGMRINKIRLGYDILREEVWLWNYKTKPKKEKIKRTNTLYELVLSPSFA